MIFNNSIEGGGPGVNSLFGYRLLRAGNLIAQYVVRTGIHAVAAQDAFTVFHAILRHHAMNFKAHGAGCGAALAGSTSAGLGFQT